MYIYILHHIIHVYIVISYGHNLGIPELFPYKRIITYIPMFTKNSGCNHTKCAETIETMLLLF